MNNYIQYHNADKLGYYPTSNIDFKTSVDLLTLDNSVKYKSQFYTKKRQVENAVGHFCFLIVGKTEKIKKYYLWSSFKIDDFIKDNGKIYRVNGTGSDFQKPILLNDLEHFNDFKKFCGNFGLGFQNIDSHSFCKTLISFLLQQNIETPNVNKIDNLKLTLLQLSEEMQKVEPEKRLAEKELTLRKDRKIVDLLKESVNYKCQFPNCNSEILTKKGTNYVEVAHINPVHKGGQSILGNLIVLCPNHHKEFDYGVLNIEEQTDKLIKGNLNGKVFQITTE